MESILQELYNGKVCPYEMIHPKSTDYHNICSNISKETEYWKQKLDVNEFERFEKLMGLMDDQNYFDCIESYISGYKLATKIAIEVFNEV